MPERVIVDSDALVVGPTFTGTDEEAAATTGVPTVTVTSRALGTTLTAPTASAGTGTGVYTVPLTTSAHTGSIDVLDLVWTGTVSGKTRVLSQSVEVVGGFYESIPNLRSITTLSSAATRPAAQLRRFRNELEDICEMARGTAFVHRCAIETHTTGPVRLKHRHVVSLLAVTIDGVAKTAADYTADPITRTLTTTDGSAVYFTDSVRVAYVHGYQSPPGALVEACREYVRAKATIDSSNANRNPTSVTELATGTVYRFGTADPKYGRWTGIEGVDERINQVDDERVLVR